MSLTANKPVPDGLLEPTGPLGDLGTKPGVLPRQRIRQLIRQKDDSGDCRDRRQSAAAGKPRPAGSAPEPIAFPRASCLGRERPSRNSLANSRSMRSILKPGAVLEKGTVYVVELMEHLSLPESVVGARQSKSSTGRLDVFTRLIADNSEVSDTVPGGYDGKLYTEISPCSFSIRVRRGSKLNQIRFRRRNPAQPEDDEIHVVGPRPARTAARPHSLVDGDIQRSQRARSSASISGASNPTDFVGYRAQKFTGVIDVDQVAEIRPARVLGAGACPQLQEADSRSQPVLHPGLARAHSHPAGLGGRRWCRSIR